VTPLKRHVILREFPAERGVSPSQINFPLSLKGEGDKGGEVNENTYLIASSYVSR
jgi:hypothetical protein